MSDWLAKRHGSAAPVIAGALREQGARFPNAGADLILKALKDAGYTIVRPLTAEEEAANTW